MLYYFQREAGLSSHGVQLFLSGRVVDVKIGSQDFQLIVSDSSPCPFALIGIEAVCGGGPGMRSLGSIPAGLNCGGFSPNILTKSGTGEG